MGVALGYLFGGPKLQYAEVVGVVAMVGPMQNIKLRGVSWHTILHWLICFVPGFVVLILLFRSTGSNIWAGLAGIVITAIMSGFRIKGGASVRRVQGDHSSSA